MTPEQERDFYRRAYDRERRSRNRLHDSIEGAIDFATCEEPREDGRPWQATDEGIHRHFDDTGCIRCGLVLSLHRDDEAFAEERAP